MQKHLLLLIALIFFIGTFLCEAQANRAATKTGTLTTSTSSGGGGDGDPFCSMDIQTSNLSLLNPTTAFLCLNDSFLLQANFSCSQGTWYYNNTPLQSFDAGVGYDRVMVNKPGIYSYSLGWPVDIGILITSKIPLDSIPGKTTFCPNGSITLNAPAGTFSAYQWYKDSELIPGENSNSYVASTSGNYFVQTTNSSNGCVLNTDKINVTVYTPPSQLNITHVPPDNSGKYLFIKKRTPYSSGPFGPNHYPGTIASTPDLTIEKYAGYGCANSDLVVDNGESDLNPETVTWYRNGNIIKKFDDKGVVIAGGNGAGSGLNQFDQPYGISIDSKKNIYVADYNNNRIMKWAPGSTSGEIVDAINCCYLVTDVLLDSPHLYTGTTEVLWALRSINMPVVTENLWAKPNVNVWGLATDSNHNLYFSNFNQIYETDSLGSFLQPVAGSGNLGSDLSNINNPNGIFVDSNNNLYVTENLTDSLNHFYGRIVRWAPGATTGELIAGGNGYGNGGNQIWFAAGVTLDKAGNMYVSDAINNRVQLWRPGADHGITIASGFTPWGIKVDDSDNVYVADQTNNRVLKFPSLLHNTIKARLPGVYKAVVTYPGGCSTSTNDFSVIDCTAPGKLLSFEGRLKNDHAVLTWQTASEYNTSYFDVQRSRDGINFTTLGKVSASANSSSSHNYLYYDDNITQLNGNKIYYRVNETDIDGKSLQSNVISIDLKKFTWNFTVSPNPIKSSLKVQINNLYGRTNVAIMDMTGRKLTLQQINASGNNVLIFNTGNLAGGLYFIQVINGGQSDYLKFVKE